VIRETRMPKLLVKMDLSFINSVLLCRKQSL
jgi:hypothetical protein